MYLLGTEDQAQANLRRAATTIFLAVATVAFLVLQITPTVGSINDRCRTEAEDENGDGDIDEEESQDCGGEVIGVGGDDGADLPSASSESHQWNSYHWTHPEGEERKIIIRDSTTGSWTDKLSNVIPDWGRSSEFRFVKQQAATDSDTRLQCPMPTYYGRVRVCNHSDYTFSGAGKATIVFNSENHIQKGKVRVKNSTDNSARRPLLCQEVGHNLGLAHRATTASCMHQNASAAAIDPDQHDYDQLVNQTHNHGGESETGGIDSNLDVGGGLLDGCSALTCLEVTSDGHGRYTIEITWFDSASAPPFLHKLI